MRRAHAVRTCAWGRAWSCQQRGQGRTRRGAGRAGRRGSPAHGVQLACAHPGAGPEPAHSAPSPLDGGRAGLDDSRARRRLHVLSAAPRSLCVSFSSASCSQPFMPRAQRHSVTKIWVQSCRSVDMSSALSELCDAYVDPESGDRPCHKIVHDLEYTNDGQMQLNDMIDRILAGTSVTPALLVCPV